MTARDARFEVVRGDSGWWARFRAANGRIVWTTEVYTKHNTAARAVYAIARGMSPHARIWYSTTRSGYFSCSEMRFGDGGDTYATAHRIEVRHLDERTVTK